MTSSKQTIAWRDRLSSVWGLVCWCTLRGCGHTCVLRCMFASCEGQESVVDSCSRGTRKGSVSKRYDYNNRKKMKTAENVLYYLPRSLSIIPHCSPVYTVSGSSTFQDFGVDNLTILFSFQTFFFLKRGLSLGYTILSSFPTVTTQSCRPGSEGRGLSQAGSPPLKGSTTLTLPPQSHKLRGTTDDLLAQESTVAPFILLKMTLDFAHFTFCSSGKMEL